MKLRRLGEFGFIERIARRVPAAEGVRLGIGDDCAVTVPPPGEVLLTTSDLLIEEVHFRRQWCDLRDLGRKSVAVNVSDIAAMGGTPRHLYLGLGVPEQTTVEELDTFMAGLLAEAETYGLTLVGGDTCRSPGPLLIAITVEGSVAEGELVTRAGAQAGDALYVSGTLGDSALGLALLQARQEPDPFLARRHHLPRARVELGRELARRGVASAMIDLSDGLAGDLGHIVKASGVGARVEREALPLSESFRRRLQREDGLWSLALSGGEDYELLFTVPPQRQDAVPEVAATTGVALTRIGQIVTPDHGVTLLGRRDEELPWPQAGFNHFAAAAPNPPSRGAL